MHCLRSKASTLSHVTPIEFETVITEVEQFLTDRESEADAWAAVGSYVRYLAGKPDKMFLELLVTPPAETTHLTADRAIQHGAVRSSLEARHRFGQQAQSVIAPALPLARGCSRYWSFCGSMRPRCVRRQLSESTSWRAMSSLIRALAAAASFWSRSWTRGRSTLRDSHRMSPSTAR